MDDDERQQRTNRILELRAENWTQKRIGEHFGISRERVRQIISKADYDRDKLTIQVARSGDTLP